MGGKDFVVWYFKMFSFIDVSVICRFKDSI